MSLRTAMVHTTVANAVVLEGYRENFIAHDHLEQIQVVVIPGRKTPSTVVPRAWVAASLQIAVVGPR
jgi:hypothetical protein